MPEGRTRRAPGRRWGHIAAENTSRVSSYAGCWSYTCEQHRHNASIRDSSTQDFHFRGVRRERELSREQIIVSYSSGSGTEGKQRVLRVWERGGVCGRLRGSLSATGNGPAPRRTIGKILNTCNFLKKIEVLGVPVVAKWLATPTRNPEVAGSVPALTPSHTFRCIHTYTYTYTLSAIFTPSKKHFLNIFMGVESTYSAMLVSGVQQVNQSCIYIRSFSVFSHTGHHGVWHRPPGARP